MVDWSFVVRLPDGSERVETFYAVEREQAAKFARGWTTRMGYELVADADEKGEAA